MFTQHNFNYTCTDTTTWVIYNLVITEVIDGLSSKTAVQLFYKYKTTDFCGTKQGSDIEHTNYTM